MEAMNTYLAGAARRLDDRWLRLLFGLAAFGLVTLVTALIAQPRMFTGFASYDDEGYMLIALDSFLNGGALYDEVYTQYGPFYYELWGGVFSVLGLSITHDAGRTVTLIVWVLSSLICGLSLFRMTGSIVLGVMSQMLVFTALGSMPNEPMHPGGTIALLLALILLVSTMVRDQPSPMAMWFLGIAIAALILVKINVGVFAIVALAVTTVTVLRQISALRAIRLIVEIGFVLSPLLLMAEHIGQPWAQDYAFHVSVAALAVVIALRARQEGERTIEELGWLGGGFLIATVTILAGIVASGTSVGGLVDGVVREPLNHSNAYAQPLGQSGRIYTFDLIALAGAIAYWYVARVGRASRNAVRGVGISIISLLIGLEMALSVIGKTLPFDATNLVGYQFSLLAFVWVALIPSPDERRSSSFARVLLPPLAVMQALHAYPVAGSQISWAVFLLVPVGGICVANGIGGLHRALTGTRERTAAVSLGIVLAATLGWFVVNETLRLHLQVSRAAHDEGVALNLPGAESIRVDEDEATRYRRITRAIESRCGSMVMLPGMNSFYFWADKEPPNGFNATGWPVLFDPETQGQIMEDARSIPDLCVLEEETLAGRWTGGTIPDGPLVRFIRTGFVPIATFGEYRLLKRPSAGGTGA